MKLNLLGANSTYVYQLLKLIETHVFRNNVEIMPITVDISFAYFDECDANEMHVYPFDYLDDNGNIAEIDIEDFYDFFQTYTTTLNSISYNDKTYTLCPVQENTPK